MLTCGMAPCKLSIQTQYIIIQVRVSLIFCPDLYWKVIFKRKNVPIDKLRKINGSAGEKCLENYLRPGTMIWNIFIN